MKHIEHKRFVFWRTGPDGRRHDALGGPVPAENSAFIQTIPMGLLGKAVSEMDVGDVQSRVATGPDGPEFNRATGRYDRIVYEVERVR